jgi:predicted metal-binding membrane protein
VMMVAMMLPSLAPMLWRYRQAVGRTGGTRTGWLTALVGVGYFFVWSVFGVAAFAAGVALAAIEMRQPTLARGVPVADGVVVLIAGALQFTSFKTHHLGCCREAPGRGRALPADAGTAFGLAFTAERLTPAGDRVARAIGAVIVGAGLFLVAQAAGLG